MIVLAECYNLYKKILAAVNTFSNDVYYTTEHPPACFLSSAKSLMYFASPSITVTFFNDSHLNGMIYITIRRPEG